MNILNPTATKPTRFNLALNTYRPSLPKPFPSSSSSVSFIPLRPSSAVKASLKNNENPKSFSTQNPNPIPLFPLLAPLKSTLVTTVAAAAILFSGLVFNFKPSIAGPRYTPPTKQTAEELNISVSEEDKEKFIEEQLLSNPSDVNLLKNLMEAKIKNKKSAEAIEILDRLIEIEPEEVEWPMMKAHLYAYDGSFELAKHGFNELLKADPFRVEAYHGLVTVASQEESSEDLKNIENRVAEAMELCKKEKKYSDVRDFKLLLAQIRVLDGNYEEALQVYDELVKDEPRDFRPHLCQGIIYTLMRKSNEAEKSFEKYRRLVPKGHPYASYFDDNMIATKIFAQKVEKERARTERVVAKN